MFTRSTSKSAWTFVWSHWLNRRLWPGGYVALMVLVLGGSGPAQAQTGTTVAGGNGPGPAANQLNFPSGVFVDGAGNVFMADQQNLRIQKFGPGSSSASSGTTVAGCRRAARSAQPGGFAGQTDSRAANRAGGRTGAGEFAAGSQ